MKNQSGNCKSSQKTSENGIWFLCSILLVLLISSTLILSMGAHSKKPSQNTNTNPSNVKLLETTRRQTDKIISTIAHLKQKKRLLTEYGDVDMFTSLRPKIGKKFSDASLEEKRCSILDQCRSRMIPISLEEINQDIQKNRIQLQTLFGNLSHSQISFEEYRKLSNECVRREINISAKVRKDHDRKIHYFVRKLNKEFKEPISPVEKPEKRIKHKLVKRLKNVEKNRSKNAKKREKKRQEVITQIQEIKSSNLVHNFSSMDVPDSAYMFLALGSSFVTAKVGCKHDDIYDIKQFSRKLRWTSFFRNMETVSGNITGSDTNTPTDQEELLRAPESLKPKNLENPGLGYQDKRLETIISKLSGVVMSFKKKRPRINLTHLEVEGMRWCQKMVKERRLYFTRVDKGGAIIILDTAMVDGDIRATLEDQNKYKAISKDPRERIKKDIVGMVDDLVSKSILSLQDRLYLTGKTEKEGSSHDHSFVVKAPYVYPLYKIHKLNHEQIRDKVKPPNRMVTSGVNGPTYRIGVFLDSVLKPVAESYCEGELVKDTADFLNRTMDLTQQNLFADPVMNMAAMDICALYPNIKIDLALVAVRSALESNSKYGSGQIDAIIKLLTYTLRNSVVHYRGSWYLSVEGAPTGNPEVPSVANIHVKYVVDCRIFVDPNVMAVNALDRRCRFLDDIWGIWKSSVEDFNLFLEAVNKIGKELGVMFTGDCGKSVEFLDVTTSPKADGCLKTNMYVKPTDCARYLNRRSYHSKHTFTGMPYSQFRRAAVICSDMDDRKTNVQRMKEKFLCSGYSPKEILPAEQKALALDRNVLLQPVAADEDEKKVVACVINQDPGLKKELNSFFKEHEPELLNLLGNVRLVVSERRHTNIAAQLFQKSGFSQNQAPINVNQKCGSGRCQTSDTMNIGRSVKINNFVVKLDYRWDCATNSVIYIGICRLCDDPLKSGSFYIGQTVNSLMSRCNGHRGCFKLSKIEKSALSMHIYEKHLEHFQDKLNCFDFGVVAQISPMNLNRREDYYIYKTDADTKGLNRYGVTK